MYFPDPKRSQRILDYVGDGHPTIRETAVDAPMCERTAYKAIVALVADGALWVSPGVPGIASGRLNRSQWLALSHDQRERAVGAMEQIAHALEVGMTSGEEQARRRAVSIDAAEQRERTLIALERIADALETMMVRKRRMETKGRVPMVRDEEDRRWG